MNFYIGGMRAASTYQLRHDVIAGARITTGPTLTFTTGALGISLPAVTSTMPLHAPTNTTDGVTSVRRAHHAFACAPVRRR